MDESKNKYDANNTNVSNEDNSTKKGSSEIAIREEMKESDRVVPVKTKTEVSAKPAARWTSTKHEEFDKEFEEYHAKVLSQKNITLTKEDNKNVPTPSGRNDKMAADSKSSRITKPNKPHEDDFDKNTSLTKEDNKNVPTPSGRNDKMAADSKSSRITKPNKPHEDDFDKNTKNETDAAYKNFMKLLRSNANIEYTKVVEVTQDLFKMSEDVSLAHCVSEDLKMGKGIAVQFKTKFKKLSELANQKQKQGGLAILSFPPRFIYYLVTKRYYWEKPTLKTLWNSLTKMQNHVQENSIQQIAIPRIGCGLDLLQWNEVKFMIEHIFRDTNVKITVCNFEQDEYTVPQSISKCWIQHAPYPVVEIEAGTMIVYFGSEDGLVDHSMEELDKKFGILADYKRGPRMLGKVIRTEAFNGDFTIFGFIVQKSSKEDQVDYVNVQKCAQEVQKFNKKFGNKGYLYLGLDVFENPLNEIMQFNEVLDILTSTLRKLEVYVCYPKDLMHLMPTGRK